MYSLQFYGETTNMRIIAIIFLCCIPSLASAAVFINEIAWMGTAVSPSDEWMELGSDESTSVDMAGWVLSIEGKKDIILSGSIGAGGYYLIERTDDTTVPTVPADLIASFGTGLANTGAILSLKNTSGVVVDRVDGSQAWNIGGVVAGNNATKETAQRGMTGWVTGAPTPRAINVGVVIPPAQESVALPSTTSTPASIPSNNSSFPVEPQIFADAGVATRSVSTGAPITFAGRVFGLKKEPIENARMVWSFGDGGRAEGTGVAHTYYYPGEYITILDVASGHYSASDRTTVRVVSPLLSLHTGGDTVRSFISIENRGSDEIALSEWQVEANGKIFVLPQNTILGARKTLTLASEVTGLVTPVGSIAYLHFPNGTRVETQNDTPVLTQAPVQVPTKEQVTVNPISNQAVASAHNSAPRVLVQKASISDAFVKTASTSPMRESGNLWPWYSGAALLGVLALLGLRFTRERNSVSSSELIADDFEIVEDEDDDKKGDIF